VFPCGPDKKPLTKHGFKDASLDPKQIAAWWTRYPQALIGMPTGHVSKTVVLDSDCDAATGKDGDSALAELVNQPGHSPLPGTVESLTPRGGRHLIFRYPEPDWTVPCSASKIAQDVDVRGDGGYVILPPSRLPDGRGYTWEGSSDPDEGVRAAELPPWLLALIGRRQAAPEHPPAAAPIPNRIPEGARNGELFSLARSLRAKGLTETGILEALRAENAARCDPPLDNSEIERIANSACRKPPGRSAEFEARRAPPPWDGYDQTEPPGPGPSATEEDWPEPADLSAAVDAEPYPVEFLPPVARDTVLEYQRFGRQPMSLCAMSALGQMALATQGLADVARNAHLVGPLSLNLLLMAESGERKSAADKVFGRAARDWQRTERERRIHDFRRAAAMEKAYRARCDGVKKRITALAGKDSEEERKELEQFQERLIELEQNPIMAPPLPLLTYEDVTQAALSYELSVGWPTAGLFSDEGGVVIGGHGMKDDSATSMLGTLNLLWDGRDFVSMRKVAATAEVQGRRFSAFLMVQPNLLVKLIEKGARHIGFVARFLLSAPITTRGGRFWVDPPDPWSALADFENAITRLLDAPLPVDRSGDDRGLLMCLKPPVMHLSPAAKRAFVDYHDAVERELCAFGEFEQVGDVASKSAENACRVAGVLQVFDRGRVSREVDLDYMRNGIGIAAWHLHEARRLFQEVEAPQNIADARELSSWLAGKGRELADRNGEPIISKDGEIALRDIQRVGPNRVRESARRDAAIEVLVDAGHLRHCGSGKQKRVKVNPKLMSVQ
jgi:hypothetical protein